MDVTAKQTIIIYNEQTVEVDRGTAEVTDSSLKVSQTLAGVVSGNLAVDKVARLLYKAVDQKKGYLRIGKDKTKYSILKTVTVDRSTTFYVRATGEKFKNV